MAELKEELAPRPRIRHDGNNFWQRQGIDLIQLHAQQGGAVIAIK